MTRLNDYRTALLPAFPEVDSAELNRALDTAGEQFVSFVVDHGLGPLWHERTSRDEFLDSRRAAEALYLAQEQPLLDVDAALQRAGIDYAVIKGAASRLLLYPNPAIRACYDIDLLVRPADRLRVAATLVDLGFEIRPDLDSISREIVLTRNAVDIDVHWDLLREGRLRENIAEELLHDLQRTGLVSTLASENAWFVFLVHPAFAKHLSGSEMGLHRVADIIKWLQSESYDWPAVRRRLEEQGVQSAAWATMRWVKLLTQPFELPGLDEMLADTRPGLLRRAWLDRWLRHDLSARTTGEHWLRLMAFSSLLHDSIGDSFRAAAGRRRAFLRRDDDMAVFEELLR